VLVMAGAFLGGPAMSQSVPVNWVEVSVDNLLTLRAPPGTVFRRQQGVDSFTGNLTGPNFVLNLDYGPFSAIPTDQPRGAQQSVQELMVDGKRAKVVSRIDPGSPTPRHFVALYVTGLLTATASKPLSLVMFARVPSSDEETLIRVIFTTIRFAHR
jgi:hypothetical protein